MKISVSRGVNEINNFDTVEFSSVKELAKQACKSNISTSVFKTGYRNIDNFEFADCIGLDIDNDNKSGTPILGIEEAARVFDGYKHVILTTRSHRKEKNGHVADRFRIILFLETPITKAEDFYATWFSLKAKYPWIDNQCKDPSRFWFKHGGVYGGKDGTLIKPVKYVAPVKQEKEVRAASPGEKGELSKETLKLLEFGVEPGGRNGAVYKAAREFNQNLYTLEEAEERIVNALERNDVFDNDFTEEEVRLTIASAFKREAKHEPRLEEIKPRTFTYATMGELLSRVEEKMDWIVDDLIPKGCLVLLAGQPKLGKSTLLRQLELSILRGTNFLDKTVAKGTVMHFSFDEKERTAMPHYRKLGLTESDPIVLHFGPAISADKKKHFEEDLMLRKPTIAVVDTMVGILESDNLNDYGQLNRELTWFSSVADRTGVTIVFVHHTGKPGKDYVSGNGNSILGSQAIFGTVDFALLFEEDRKKPEKRNLIVKGRFEGSFTKVLKFDRVKQVYTIDEVEF